MSNGAYRSLSDSPPSASSVNQSHSNGISASQAATSSSALLQHLASASASASPALRATQSNKEHVYKQYPIRWLILFIFCLLTMTNAILWIAFAPISDLTESYYGVSKTSVNLLSMSFMGLYLPGYFLAFYTMDTYGLRRGLITAAVLQTIGAWIRYVGIIGSSSTEAHQTSAYVLCFIGQCFGAMAQPMFTNAPAKLSSEWFSVAHRNLATTIAAMSNPIGIAVGQLLPTNLVNSEGGMSTLLLVSGIISSATLVLCVIFVKSQPPTPPSHSTYIRNLARMEHDELQKSSGKKLSFWEGPLMVELKQLLTNKHFLILMFGVGIGLGLFNAVTTLIEQLVKPAGYNKDDAGNFGALLIGCGLVGAGIVGPIMDTTHAYNKILKAGLLAAFGGTCFMLFTLKPNQFTVVAVAFGFLGAVMLPLLPVCMECAAECTYPVSEDASSGLMLFCGNFVGIIMIIAVGDLIEETYHTVFNPACITLLCFLALAVFVVGLTYDGPLKRQAAEKESADEVIPEVSLEPDTHSGLLP